MQYSRDLYGCALATAEIVCVGDVPAAFWMVLISPKSGDEVFSAEDLQLYQQNWIVDLTNIIIF